MSGTCTNPRSSIARAAALLRLGGAGYARRFISSTSGVRLWCATKWRSWPSNRYTKQNWPSQSRLALSAIMSNTGWTSVGERLMTLSTSAVATCCSRASFSSRVSRATSVSWPATKEPRAPTDSGALRRFDVTTLWRCDLARSRPALERRLIAFPRLRTRHRDGSDYHTGGGRGAGLSGSVQCSPMSADGSSVNISQCPANVRYSPKADMETFGDANAVRRERVPYSRPFCQKFDGHPFQKYRVNPTAAKVRSAVGRVHAASMCDTPQA